MVESDFNELVAEWRHWGIDFTLEALDIVETKVSFSSALLNTVTQTSISLYTTPLSLPSYTKNIHNHNMIINDVWSDVNYSRYKRDGGQPAS